MAELVVAKTILEQLGGRRFIAMTGAKDFIGSSASLMFRLPKAKQGINKVVIELTPGDVYTVRFMRYRNFDVKEIKVVEDVYCDQLVSVFEGVTGLDTHL